MKSSEFEMQNVKTCSVQKVCKKGALQNGEMRCCHIHRMIQVLSSAINDDIEMACYV